MNTLEIFDHCLGLNVSYNDKYVDEMSKDEVKDICKKLIDFIDFDGINGKNNKKYIIQTLTEFINVETVGDDFKEVEFEMTQCGQCGDMDIFRKYEIKN